MVDFEPFLESPFEEASNVSFEALLLFGIGLLVAVAVLGRSPATMAAVVVYLCLIPGYVGYRGWIWDRETATTDDQSETDDESNINDEDVSDT
ncbi:hypothetical protein HYG81_01290 [Natrinema zhouii]|uniref:Uncharacterized protein n=1 Tax=Natrinema zhouii TaxID=1710539 RepID=A0A7D6H372_9EURY|nr:hypothetical protein [Natrinema zhouii]QLK26287.1 hypothetical protein HYG81_01290 [Natrinema zhouii]